MQSEPEIKINSQNIPEEIRIALNAIAAKDKCDENSYYQKWLNFFAEKGHKIEPSAPLVPHNDASLWQIQ